MNYRQILDLALSDDATPEAQAARASIRDPLASLQTGSGWLASKLALINAAFATGDDPATVAARAHARDLIAKASPWLNIIQVITNLMPSILAIIQAISAALTPTTTPPITPTPAPTGR